MNINDRTTNNSIPDPSCFEITDAKFDELFNTYRVMIEETSFGKDNVPPSISIHYRQFENGMPGDIESALIIIDRDFNDADEKRDIMRKIGRQCFAKCWIMVSVCMASEAWMSTRSKDNPNLELAPSKDPSRKECIMIAGRTLMGECKKCCMIPVSRDQENKFIKTAEPEIITSELDTFLLDHLLDGFREAISKYVGRK